MDQQKLRTLVFEKTGVKIDIDDPIFALVALNEAVVTKGSQARLIEFKLSIDGEYVYRLRADGARGAAPVLDDHLLLEFVR